MIFKEQLTNISTVLNNTGNTTKLLVSFSALDASQQKVLLSSKLLTEEQKEQCIVMSMLSSANTKYTAEQLSKTAGISAETLANWGLTSSTDTLTVSELAEKAATDAQAKSALEKIVAQNAQAVANGELTASNVTLTASETGTTLATGAFTTAIKANISAMKTWLLTTPAGWITMLVGGIFLAVKAYDALTVSVEEQKEKMEDSLSAYNDAKSELENITTELDNQKQAMDELLGKEKLTYAEKGQLEELQQITEELRIQKDLAKKEESRTQKEVASDAATLFKKQFGKYDISDEAIDEYQTNANATGNNAILVSDENDLSAMIAGYKQFNDLLDEAYGEKNQKDIDHFTSLTEDLKDSIFSTAQDLQTQQDNMSDYYNTIKNVPYDELTSDQKEVVDAYTAISNAIALIYKELDPNSWNEMQIDKLFTTDGIEKTKDELVEMAKEGTLDESTIQSYSKLNSTLEDSNMILNDGQSAASALCDEMYALADAEDNVQSSKLNETPISKSGMIDEINALSDGFDILDKIYADIKDGDVFDFTNLDSSKFTEAFSGLEDEYTAFIEKVSASPNDLNGCQDAFDDLVSAWLESKGVLNDVTDDTAQLTISMLENMGVSNAEEIVTATLAQRHEEAAIAKTLEANSTSDLSNVTGDEITNLLNEGVITEDTAQKMAAFALKKQFINQNTVNTAADCENIIRLAEVAGAGTEALTKLEALKQRLADNPIMSNEMKSNITSQINTIVNGVYTSATKNITVPQLKYSGGNSSNKKSSSGSSSKSSTDELKEQFQAEYDLLKHNLEMEYITEEDYYNGVQALNEKYFAGKEEYLDEYRKYEEEVYKGLKSYYKSYCDDMMDYYDKKLDASKMSYKEYCDSVSKMLADMHKSGKISDKDWYDYTKTMLEKQKDAYDRALSAITRRLQKEIDAWKAKIDALNDQNDALNKQKDNYDKILSVVSNVYDKEIDRLNEQKDLLQDQIDALNDKNDALDLQYRKEQALYALQKAQQQRTRKLYVEGKGYIYDTDNEAIRDAQNNLSDIKNEELINSLQKEQDKLQESIDILNQYKEKWNEIPDAWEKAANEQLAIGLWGQEYEKLILMNRTSDIENFKTTYLGIQSQLNDNEQLIASYEEKIQYYEMLKEQWSSLSDDYSNNVEDMYAKQLIGQQWETDVLNGRIQTLNDFRNEYNRIQQAISDMAWNSANAQIAAQNAIKEAEATKAKTSGGSNGYSGSSGTATKVGSSGGSGTATPKVCKIIDENSGRLLHTSKSESEASSWISSNGYSVVSNYTSKDGSYITYEVRKNATKAGRFKVYNTKTNKYVKTGFSTFAEAQNYINSTTPALAKYLQVKGYAKGTQNAERGIKTVSEKGDEIVISKDEAKLVHGEQLYDFQGGEKVIPSDETKEILKHQGNVTRMPDGRELFEDGSIKFPDGTMMTPVPSLLGNITQTEFAKAMKNVPLPHYQQKPMNYSNITKTENNNNTVTIGDIHLHNVQNVDQLGADIDKYLTVIVAQKLNRRR